MDTIVLACFGPEMKLWVVLIVSAVGGGVMMAGRTVIRLASRYVRVMLRGLRTFMPGPGRDLDSRVDFRRAVIEK